MFQKLTDEQNQPLPSLNALRAFEAMARTGSATRAAEELHVTHSAISRQVKALEGQLGVRLFEGPRHALALTATGRDLLPALTSAFDEMATAVARARGTGHDLHVAVNASLAVKWLIPRLSSLRRDLPQLRVHMADLASHATTHRGADVIVRLLSREQVTGLSATAFIPNAIGPVMAPHLVGDDLYTVLSEHPLLVARTYPSGWQEWSELSGIKLPFHATWSRPLAHLHFVLDAALSGLGTAILPWALVADAVNDGRLVAPYGFSHDGGALAALSGAGDMTQARRDFTRWLIQQGQEMPPPPAARNW